MALQHLDDEQIRTWTREQKDRWWLENVYRGDMPQLTIRAAVTGFLLGGVLSATNLYIGAKTGWSLGVGVTSVILAYAMFKVFGRLGLMKGFTILENNAVQSVATAAGYMTAPLISSLTAFMVMTNTILPWWKIFLWNVVTSVLGVLVAFPMKRRFVNDEQQPFPEGRACAVVLDSLYPDAPEGGTNNMVDGHPQPKLGADVDPYHQWLGVLKAQALFVAAGLAGAVEFLKLEGYQTLIQQKLLGMEKVWHLPERMFDWYYDLAEKHQLWIPKIMGTDIRQLAITPTLDITMFGAGGLTGLRIANSLMIGAILNYGFLAPWMIAIGDIPAKADGTFGRGYLLNSWCLWWGVAIMVTGSLTGLFAKPEMILSSFRGLFAKKKEDAHDVLGPIELPLKVSFVGVPIVAALAVYMNHAWFGINPLLGFLSVPMIIVLTLIAANATGLTSTTPTGSLSKITQFTFGALDRANPATNLITAGMTSEVASNASNLLMDIKPGYMLGAKPRQQAWGHLIGVISGGIASTFLFFPLFLPKYDASRPLGEQVMSDKFPMPGVELWKGVAELIASGGHSLVGSAIIAMIVAAIAGVVMEVLRVRTKGRFALSAVSIGLGVVLPVDSTLMMWLGALFFHFMEKRYSKRDPQSTGHGLWVESQEPIAAGIVAGAALTGIGDQLISVFVLGG